MVGELKPEFRFQFSPEQQYTPERALNSISSRVFSASESEISNLKSSIPASGPPTSQPPPLHHLLFTIPNFPDDSLTLYPFPFLPFEREVGLPASRSVSSQALKPSAERSASRRLASSAPSFRA